MKNEQINAAEMERLRLLTQYEMALYSEGVRMIAGIDEAGRGPLAGPVVAAAVILPETFVLAGVNDSKKLSAGLREELAIEIKKRAICWAVGMVFPPHLDAINIYQATKLAMRKAVNALQIRPDHLIIDAVKLPELGIAQTPLIKGDAKSISVASASIIAKVERDFIMNGLEELYPGYGLAKHKGYATKDHIQALNDLGPSPVHRRSFEPVKSMVGGEANGDQGRLFD